MNRTSGPLGTGAPLSMAQSQGMLKALGAGLHAAAGTMVVAVGIYGVVGLSQWVYLRYIAIPRMRRKTLDEIRRARREKQKAGQR